MGGDGMSEMGRILIEHGPAGFDCGTNTESLPAWVPAPTICACGHDQLDHALASATVTVWVYGGCERCRCGGFR